MKFPDSHISWFQSSQVIEISRKIYNNYWMVSGRQELLWQNVLENLVFDFFLRT